MKKKENIFQSLKLSDIKNGGLTGLFTILLIQPFQVIKTSMIVIYNNQKRIKMWDVIKQIKSDEGIKGFYRGFSPSVIKAVFGYSIFFGSLEFNKKALSLFLNLGEHREIKNPEENFNDENFLGDKKLLKKKNFSSISSSYTKNYFSASENFDNYCEIPLKNFEFEYMNNNNNQIKSNNQKLLELERNENKNNKKSQSILNFLASGMARFIQAFSVAPILIIKTRNEVLGFNSYGNLLDAFKQIKKQEGFKGFYTGLRTTLMKDVPAAGLFYMSYEFIKNKINLIGFNNIQIKAILASCLTSFLLVLLTNPLEVIRTRQQYQHFSTNPEHEYSNVSQGFLRIWQYEGLRGFFVGIAPRLMKKGVGSVIVWTTYESLKNNNKE